MGGPDVGKPCVFPFKMNNVTFSACTTEGQEDYTPSCSALADRRPRCSTLVNEEGHHVDYDHWGYCGDGCPIYEPGLGKNNTTDMRFILCTRFGEIFS